MRVWAMNHSRLWPKGEWMRWTAHASSFSDDIPDAGQSEYWGAQPSRYSPINYIDESKGTFSRAMKKSESDIKKVKHRRLHKLSSKIFISGLAHPKDETRRPLNTISALPWCNVTNEYLNSRHSTYILPPKNSFKRQVDTWKDQCWDPPSTQSCNDYMSFPSFTQSFWCSAGLFFIWGNVFDTFLSIWILQDNTSSIPKKDWKSEQHWWKFVKSSSQVVNYLRIQSCFRATGVMHRLLLNFICSVANIDLFAFTTTVHNGDLHKVRNEQGQHSNCILKKDSDSLVEVLVVIISNQYWPTLDLFRDLCSRKCNVLAWVTSRYDFACRSKRFAYFCGDVRTISKAQLFCSIVVLQV